MRAYIHGFSFSEQARLIRQATVLEREVFRGLDFSDAVSLLEVGCGVGAELQIFRRRWPHLRFTGLDISPLHLAAAHTVMHDEIRDGLATLVEGDACNMPFANASFDRVVTIWTLEHVADLAAVMGECLRVLKPEGCLICTEVDNNSFGFSPVQPVILDWWDRFNRYQEDAGGQPYVGPRLAGLAQSLHARDIAEETLPIISSRRAPDRREELLDYLAALLLSAADQLRDAGLADDEDVQSLRDVFEAVRSDPAVHFQYFATRMTCCPPGREGQ